MYDENQTFVPDSFIALYQDGYGRLTISKKELAQRYEHCESLAQSLIEVCQLALTKDGDEDWVLGRCHASLQSPPTAMAASLARWVILRTAELLEWKPRAALVSAA